LWAPHRSLLTNTNHTERMVLKTNKSSVCNLVEAGKENTSNDSSGEDGTQAVAERQQKDFNATIAGMRGTKTRKNYIELLDNLIQAVVTYKKFRMNRTTNPLSEWVTVTDEAFLLLCLANYSNVWIHECFEEPQMTQTPAESAAHENESAPLPCWTAGVGQGGRKRSWSKKGMEIFNKIMIRVFADRKRNGTKFDAQFMQAMQDKYEPKRQENDDYEHGDATIRKKETIILSDFNVESFFMAQQALEDGGDEATEDDDVDNDDLDSDSNDCTRHEEV